MPDAPTFAEIGVELYTWNAIEAPAATLKDIVAKLHRDFGAVLKKKAEVRDRLAEIGADPMELVPQEFQHFVSSVAKKWGDIARKAGAKLD